MCQQCLLTGFTEVFSDISLSSDRSRVTCCDVLCFDSDMPLPFASAGRPDKPVFSSSKETSSIVVEKKDEITASLGASGSSRMIDGSSRSMHDAVDDDRVQSVDVTAGPAAAAADASKTATVVNTTHIVCAHRLLSAFRHSIILLCHCWSGDEKSI